MYSRERKKVACIVPPYYRLIETKNNRLAPAMHYIAEVLYREGHDVVFINGDYADESHDYSDRYSMALNSWLFEDRYKNGHESYEYVVKLLADFKPDFVFLSAGDVLMPTVELGSTQSCAYLARRIKQELGNGVTCIGYGHLLKFAKPGEIENLDLIITGEGEERAIEIVNGKLRGAVPVSWCGNLDSLPILTSSYLYYTPEPEDWDYIMSMRGCPNRCTFCHQPSLRGYNVSHMTPERFLREIRYRIENYGTTGMYFTDMIFLPGSGPRTIEMIDRLILCKKDYPDFNWWAEARVDTFSKRNIAEKMKASGCRHLKFGVEMGNQDMLNSVKKGISLDEVRKAFALAGELQIEKTAYVLLGCPGFNDDDYKDMWHFFKDLNADNYVVNINVPYAGTELHEQVRDRLYDFGLYRDGEESFIHISLEMKEFWGISDETIDMYFSLPGKKDDSNMRRYKRHVVDRDFFRKSGKIAYIDSEAADPDSRLQSHADGIRT